MIDRIRYSCFSEVVKVLIFSGNKERIGDSLVNFFKAPARSNNCERVIISNQPKEFINALAHVYLGVVYELKRAMKFFAFSSVTKLLGGCLFYLKSCSYKQYKILANV